MRLVHNVAAVHDAPSPTCPVSLEAVGIAADRIEQLLVKHLYLGEATGLILAERVRLPYTLIEPLVERMRAERLVEVRGALGTGSAAYRYALTDLGRDRARQYLDISEYVGPAPVPLATYNAYMEALAQARGYIDRDRMRQGFAHLVVPDQVSR